MGPAGVGDNGATTLPASTNEAAPSSAFPRFGNLCSRNAPCLFHLENDPEERTNLALEFLPTTVTAAADPQTPKVASVGSEHERVYKALLARLETESAQGPEPVSRHGDTDAFPGRACAKVQHTGSWLPFIESPTTFF